MSKKRYEVKGMMEWHPEFRVGRTRLQVSFTGGHLCGGAATAAAYETSDPVVQAVIEQSAPFRNGRIRLVMGSGHSDRHAEGAVARKVMEFENLTAASDYLQDKKKIPVDRVLTAEQCIAEAKGVGIELKLKESASR